LIRSVGTIVASEPRRLVVDVPGWPGSRPGQFAMLELDPDRRHLDPLLPRPMAVYRAEETRVEFRFRPVGRGTALLGSLPDGARLGVLGPLGNGFDVAAERGASSGGTLLVGGGTGIASLYELARSIPEAEVLLGGRTRDEVLGLDDFEALGARVRVATDDGSAGHRGLVTELLEPAAGDTVYACGPNAMMRRAFEIARAAGARCRVSLESHMACGFGVCLGCAVPTDSGFRYVCTHGPVFDPAAIDWEGLA
jgi:dihydroorotate dehydrogenase electron transfer subunit